VLEIREIRAEVTSLGLHYRHELLSRAKRRARGADADRIGVVEATSLLALTCRHFAGSRPFCLEERLISLAAVPEAAEEDFAAIPPGTWLMRQVPWTAAEHRIRALAADTALAASLMLHQGTACLVIERRTWRAEQPVTFVRLTYPGDAHELVARFAPSQA
jgi:GntR family histidine utilization transcriptional repressor